MDKPEGTLSRFRSLTARLLKVDRGELREAIKKDEAERKAKRKPPPT